MLRRELSCVIVIGDSNKKKTYLWCALLKKGVINKRFQIPIIYMSPNLPFLWQFGHCHIHRMKDERIKMFHSIGWFSRVVWGFTRRHRTTRERIRTEAKCKIPPYVECREEQNLFVRNGLRMSAFHLRRFGMFFTGDEEQVEACT